MTLPDGRFILKRNFVEKLLPWAREEEAVARNDENSTITRKYCLLTHDSTSYWAPDGIVGVPENKLVCLWKQAKVAINWLHLFAGQRCWCLSRFLRTLSEFSLHNMAEMDGGLKTKDLVRKYDT